MTIVSQVMTRDVEVIHPDATLQRAAECMSALDIGLLPVCDGNRLIGIITDRDITVRATARGLWPNQCLVGDVMSNRVVWCTEEQTVDEVLKQMNAEQLRRLPVLGAGRRVVGIVSRRDLMSRHATPLNLASPPPPSPRPGARPLS